MGISEEEMLLIPFSQITAIEIYQTLATTPADYAGLSQCGVIVIWTVRPPL